MPAGADARIVVVMTLAVDILVLAVVIIRTTFCAGELELCCSTSSLMGSRSTAAPVGALVGASAVGDFSLFTAVCAAVVVGASVGAAVVVGASVGTVVVVVVGPSAGKAVAVGASVGAAVADVGSCCGGVKETLVTVALRVVVSSVRNMIAGISLRFNAVFNDLRYPFICTKDVVSTKVSCNVDLAGRVEIATVWFC